MAQTTFSFNSLYEFELLSFHESCFQMPKINTKTTENRLNIDNDILY